MARFHLDHAQRILPEPIWGSSVLKECFIDGRGMWSNLLISPIYRTLRVFAPNSEIADQLKKELGDLGYSPVAMGQKTLFMCVSRSNGTSFYLCIEDTYITDTAYFSHAALNVDMLCVRIGEKYTTEVTRHEVTHSMEEVRLNVGGDTNLLPSLGELLVAKNNSTKMNKEVFEAALAHKCKELSCEEPITHLREEFRYQLSALYAGAFATKESILTGTTDFFIHELAHDVMNFDNDDDYVASISRRVHQVGFFDKYGHFPAAWPIRDLVESVEAIESFFTDEGRQAIYRLVGFDNSVNGGDLLAAAHVVTQVLGRAVDTNQESRLNDYFNQMAGLEAISWQSWQNILSDGLDFDVHPMFYNGIY